MGRTKPCPKCDGTGLFNPPYTAECFECGGKGFVNAYVPPVERLDPKAILRAALAKAKISELEAYILIQQIYEESR